MIEKVAATVYYAPTAGRRYLTKRGAIRAEADAMIKRKYPTEPYEEDTGAGFHWRELDGAEKMFRRVCRLVAKSCIRERHT